MITNRRLCRMATNISDWYQNVLNYIPGLPYPALIDAGRKISRRFCKETWLWKNTLDLIDVVEDTSAYTLTIPAALYAELEAVPDDGVRYKQDGLDEELFNNLTCTSEDELDALYPNWRYKTHPTPSMFYVDNVNKNVNLVYTPEDASTEGLEVSVILKPSRTSTVVPDFLYDDYEEVIQAGMLSELFNRSSEQWYDPVKAGQHEVMFRNGVNDGKIKRFTGKTNKPTNIKMRFFA
jgi:hypothetical protein